MLPIFGIVWFTSEVVVQYTTVITGLATVVYDEVSPYKLL